MNEAYIVKTIIDYIERIDTGSYVPAGFAAKSRAYSLMAAEEILSRVMDELSLLPPHITGRPSRSHIDVIEEFIDEMDRLHSISTSEENKLMYSCGMAIGLDIINLFL